MSFGGISNGKKADADELNAAFLEKCKDEKWAQKLTEERKMNLYRKFHNLHEADKYLIYASVFNMQGEIPCYRLFCLLNEWHWDEKGRLGLL